MINFSPFAEEISLRYRHKVNGVHETWDEVANRVTKNVMRAVGVDMRATLSKDIRAAIATRKFMPAGRYLYSAGMQFHQCCNCFQGDTRMVTKEGTKRIKDAVGNVTLMTTKGEWTDAEVKQFGKQRLYKVVLGFGSAEKVIYATAEHSWRVAKRVYNDRLNDKIKVDTKDLKPGDRMWQVYGYGISRTYVCPFGVQQGLVYGDGGVSRSKCRLRLCGQKEELLRYFPLVKTRKIDNDIEILDLPKHFKQKPSLDYDRSFLLGWLAGYFAADGCVSKKGQVSLSSADKQALQFVKDVAYLIGVGVNSIRSTERVSNLTKEKGTLYTVTFDKATLTSSFFLQSKHRKRFEQAPARRKCCWKVKSVRVTDRVENVYCAVVPGTHEFVLEDNILVGNCLALRAHDSREGWSELTGKACKALMTGAGVGVVYSDIRHEGALIRKTGGLASGPLPLIQMINECGRGVMQGGVRRSAIWAGLHWNHPDIHKFIRAKNWPDEIKALKAKDYSFPGPLDHTNISVILDDDFFAAYEDDEDPEHPLAHSVYWAVIEQMLRTGEPAFTVDVGKNAGENGRNACCELTTRDTDDVCLIKGTPVLTRGGWKNIENIVCDDEVAWIDEYGRRKYAKPTFAGLTNSNAQTLIITTSTGAELTLTPSHKVCCGGVWTQAKKLKVGDFIDTEMESDVWNELTPIENYNDWFALGWLIGDGWCSNKRSLGVCAGPTERNCFRVVSERLESWCGGRVSYQTQANGVLMASVTSKPAAKKIREKWGLSIDKAITKRIPQTVWMASKGQKAAFLAGLFAADGTVKTNSKNVVLASSSKKIRKGARLLLFELGVRAWDNEYKVPGRNPQGVVVVNGASAYKFAKLIGFGHHNKKQKELETKLNKNRRKLSQVDVEYILRSIKTSKELSSKFKCSPSYIRKIRRKEAKGVRLRDTDTIKRIEKGPQGEVYDLTIPVSGSFVADTLKVHNCNLGSLNLGAIDDIEEMKYLVDISTAFLLAGSVYTDVPYSDVDKVLSKNRRLGLGLMGIHEWLLKRGKAYGPDEELGVWLKAYSRSGKYANSYADEWGLKRPKKTRAIAPNGTTGIVAETTGGIEPIFCVAYKRAYLKGTQQHYQYVVDPVAKRLIADGVDPSAIEDAYDLAQNVERRVAFQAWVQQYVDHAISSTINLPAWGSEHNNKDTVRAFGSMLYRYLPQIRGVTSYPDGSRGGQPLTPVTYGEAVNQEGIELVEEQQNVCSLIGGSCGD